MPQSPRTSQRIFAALRVALASHRPSAERGEWTLRTLAGAAFVVAALAASTAMLIHASSVMSQEWDILPMDGFIDWGGAKELVAGHDPYSEASLVAIGLSKDAGLGHPPTTLLWFLPLAHLNMVMMKHVFTIFTLIMLAYHVGLLVRDLNYPCWPVTSLLVFSAVYQTDWFLLHLQQVDLSELIALLYTLCWFFLRRGRDGTAGIMAGLACSLKLYPGLLVVFLILGRRWRAVVAAGATYLMFMLEAVRRLGLRCFKNFFEQTGSYATKWLANIRNASIDGIVHRWFYPLWKTFPQGTPVRLDATLIAAAISLTLFVLAYRVSRAELHAAQLWPTTIDLPFALFSVLSMAPGPYQWEHYNVTLLLPFLIVLRYVAPRYGAWAWHRIAIVVPILVLVAVMLDGNLAKRSTITPSSPILQLVYYDTSSWAPWFLLVIVLVGLLATARAPHSPTKVHLSSPRL